MNSSIEDKLKKAELMERELDSLEIKYFFSAIHDVDIENGEAVFSNIREAINQLKIYQVELYKQLTK